MTERLDCPKQPIDKCDSDTAFKEQEEKVKRNPYLYRAKIIMR